jgi:putative spermidine/putrescine transport system ATP-binding protein
MSEPDLQLRGLTKTYGAHTAVDGFDLEVAPGEFIALLGPSGCGKTTTLRMVAGFVEPTAGTILLGGRDVTAVPPHLRNMGMVFQSYALFPHMTVRKNIEFGLRSHRVDAKEIERRTQEVVALVGLGQYRDRYPRELSGGQQQRVALARVLALKPRLLLFDEPLSNLDAKLRVQMRYEIRRLQREVGITSLFVTHDQDEAMSMADRIVVLNQGRTEQIGAPEDIYDRPSSRFVADFIGASNFFPGAIVRDEGRASFRCASGLVIPLAVGADAQAATELAVRPERVEMRSGAGGAAGFSGTIVNVVQFGAVKEYVVRLGTGDDVRVHVQRRVGAVECNLGDEVTVGWPVDAVVLLQR